MPRKVSFDALWRLFQAVCRRPGSRPADLARELGWHRSQVTRLLPHLEDYGLRLVEDDEGRLYPFELELSETWDG